MNRKAVATMYGFIIGLFVVSFTIIGFMLFTSHGSAAFGVSYSNESVVGYDQMSELNAQASSLESGVMNISTAKGDTDILGSIVTSAYQTAQTTSNSFSVFYSMLTVGISQLGLPMAYSILLTNFLIGIAILTIAVLLLMLVVKMII